MKKRNMDEIIKLLQDHINPDKPVSLKILAEHLQINARRLRVIKTRGSIPHEILLDYCYRNKFDPLKLFYA